MGYYALAGKEQDKRLKCVLKTYMQTDINKRRDYVKTLSLGTVERAMGKRLDNQDIVLREKFYLVLYISSNHSLFVKSRFILGYLPFNARNTLRIILSLSSIKC